MELSELSPKKDLPYKIRRNEKRPPKQQYRIPVPTLGKLRNGFVRIRYTRIVEQRPKAHRLLIEGFEYWFPKSCCKTGLDPSSMNSYAVDVPITMARMKGLAPPRNR
jgi:hypothetical protein